MKNKSKEFYIKLLIFILLLIISFGYNAPLGSFLISIFVLVQLFLSRAFLFAVLGGVKYSKGDKVPALEWYKRASDVKGCKPKIKSTYGYLLLKEGNVAASEEILQEVMKCKLSTRDENQLKLTYALIKWKQGKLDDAILMVEDVHNNFRCSTAYESLGYLLILKGDYEKALEFNLEAYDYDSANDVIIDNLGQTYYFMKEYDKALEIYEKLTKKDLAFAEPYYYYGLTLDAKGRREEGIQMLEKALTFKESFLSSVTKSKIQDTLQDMKKPE
jgi:tetratricopeptide (TPR) repeat protein